MVNKLKKMQKSAYLAVAFVATSNSALAADAAASTGIDYKKMADSVNFADVTQAMGVVAIAIFGVLVAYRGIRMLFKIV